MAETLSFDAIVIGSGISGGWASKELTSLGLQTLMLERGRNVEHIKDYPTASLEPWEVRHRGLMPQELLRTHPVQRRASPFNPLNAHFWVNDTESPYTELQPFSWFRGYQLGGRSLIWGRQSYRFSPMDFEANARDGVAVDWPIRYEDLAPWYDHVERFAGISGARDGLPQLPDGEFLPPMPMNCAEEFVAKGIFDRYKGERRMINGRTANLTEAHNGRGRCQYRNQCSQGCPFGAYFSTQSATLPAAMETGRLTLRTHAIVTEILYNRDTRRARGVRVLDAIDGSTREYTARVVFLCASTLNSAWVLMNSATEVWPEGLGSSSGELGHNVTDHHIRVGASGLVPGFDDRYHSGRRPSGIYVPRFRNLGADKRDYLRGFGYQGSASRVGWQRNIAELGFGAKLKEALVEPGPWSIGLVGFGETLPHHDNRVTLDKTREDKWGLPVLAMDCRIRENEQRMRVDMKNDAAEMLEASGVTNVWAFDDYYEFGSTIHEMGAARMGRSPKTSVLNGSNQVWDAPNVFVTDGACMTSSACQNPSLTYMALTARAAHFAAEEMKRGNL